jgi:hypothetical protein
VLNCDLDGRFAPRHPERSAEGAQSKDLFSFRASRVLEKRPFNYAATRAVNSADSGGSGQDDEKRLRRDRGGNMKVKSYEILRAPTP